MQRNLDKGREQLARVKAALAERDAEIERLDRGDATPPERADEAGRVEYVRNEFWRFVARWISTLPDAAAPARQHKALHEELLAEMADLWAEHLQPQLEARIGG